MKTLTGSEKQIKWAEALRAEYLRLVKEFGGEEVDCADSKFWINNAQVTNISYSNVPLKLEAYNFLRSESFIDNTQQTLREQSKNGLISRDAAMLIIKSEVK